MENKAFKKAGIKNLITKNYKLDANLFNLEALVDDEITMSENWFNTIKPIVFSLLPPEQKYYYMGFQ